MNPMIFKKKMLPCPKKWPPLKGDQLKSLFMELAPGWKLIDEHHLEKEYRFKNFQEALDFTNKVGAIAEQKAMIFSPGDNKDFIWTHKINACLKTTSFSLSSAILYNKI